MIELLLILGAMSHSILGMADESSATNSCLDYIPTATDLSPVYERLSEVDIVLIGEVHGRTAAPCLVRRLLETTHAGGRPAALALELPNNTSIEGIRVEGTQQQIINALEQIPFWSTPPFDGRQSRGWLDLILATSTSRFWTPIGFVSPSTSSSEVSQNQKRNVMTEGIMALHSSIEAGGITIGLMGNNWTRNTSVCDALRRRDFEVLCIDVVRLNRQCHQSEITWDVVSPSAHRLAALPPELDHVDFYVRVSCDRSMPPAFSTHD